MLSTLHIFFFFNDTATTEIYTLSLHDALPISFLPLAPGCRRHGRALSRPPPRLPPAFPERIRESFPASRTDRKSTRLNSSHGYISYAVFCLKKKKQIRVVYDHIITQCTRSYDH